MSDTQLTYDMIFELLKDLNTQTNLCIPDKVQRKQVDRKLKQVSALINVVHFAEVKKTNL